MGKEGSACPEMSRDGDTGNDAGAKRTESVEVRGSYSHTLQCGKGDENLKKLSSRKLKRGSGPFASAVASWDPMSLQGESHRRRAPGIE